jgi:hypothetical protein
MVTNMSQALLAPLGIRVNSTSPEARAARAAAPPPPPPSYLQYVNSASPRGSFAAALVSRPSCRGALSAIAREDRDVRGLCLPRGSVRQPASPLMLGLGCCSRSCFPACSRHQAVPPTAAVAGWQRAAPGAGAVRAAQGWRVRQSGRNGVGAVAAGPGVGPVSPS